MPEELKSFLVSVSIILVLALFIPCIESIVKLVRRNSQRHARTVGTEMKPAKRFRGEAA